MLTNPDFRDEVLESIIKHVYRIRMLINDICSYQSCRSCPLNMKDGSRCLMNVLERALYEAPELHRILNQMEKQPKHPKPIEENNNDKTR